MITIADILATLAAASLKITVVLAVAAIIHLVARRGSAAFRHMVWTVALSCCLGVLLLPALLPAWNIVPVPQRVADVVPQRTTSDLGSPVFPPSGASATSKTAANVASSNPVDTGSNDIATSVASSTPAPSASIWPQAALAGWAGGLILLACHYLVGAFRLRRLIGGATISAHGTPAVRLQELAHAMKISRPVRLYESADVDVPMTWGTLYPRVVLPQTAVEWQPARLVSVLQHELAHVKRFDALTQSIAHFTCSVFWFHPMVWLAARQMRLQRERACDDHVLAVGISASSYASDLLEMVSAFRTSERYPVALAMARRSQFEGRLLALLDPRVDRAAVTAPKVAIVLVVAGSLVLPLAAMHMARPEAGSAPEIAANLPAEPVADTQTETAAEAASTAEPTIAQTGPAVKVRPIRSGMFAGCSKVSDSTSTQSLHEDDGSRHWTVKWKAGDCSSELKAEGKVTFNSDLTGVQSISRDGYIDINTNIHGEQTRVSVRPAGNSLEYRFWRNGHEEPFSPKGGEWFAEYMVMLDRQSAFAVDMRLPALLNAGGPSLVLDEVEQMYSDYAKATYLVRLQKTKLTPADLRRTFGLAGSIGSDYDTARVLIAAADSQDINETGVRAAFLNAAATLESDYEHARTLLAFLGKTSPSPEQVQTILSSASKIGSDYELARVLVDVASRHLLTSAVTKLYFSNVNRLGSDYERSRTLVAALENYKADDAVAMEVIGSASKIGSDYEKSRVLLTLAHQRPFQGALRDAYVRAGEQIGSDYHRKQVLDAVSRPAEMI